jgi:hypothetical protein
VEEALAMRPELTCPACAARVILPTDLRDAEIHCPRCHATIPNLAASIQEAPAFPSTKLEQESAIIGPSQVGDQSPKEATIQEEPAVPPANLDPESAITKNSFPDRSIGWLLPDWFYGCLVAALFLPVIIYVIVCIILWLGGGVGDLGRIG